MSNTVVVDLNEFDCDGCVVDTVPTELTLDQLSDIVSYAAQLVVELRGNQVLCSADELYEVLVEAGIFVAAGLKEIR